MRALAGILGLCAGVTLTLTVTRYGPRILWHIFTTDVRSTR